MVEGRLHETFNDRLTTATENRENTFVTSTLKNTGCIFSHAKLLASPSRDELNPQKLNTGYPPYKQRGRIAC